MGYIDAFKNHLTCAKSKRVKLPATPDLFFLPQKGIRFDILVFWLSHLEFLSKLAEILTGGASIGPRSVV